MDHIKEFLLTRFLQVILAVGVLLGATQAAASDVRFVGAVAYAVENDLVELGAERIENFTTFAGSSGTLKMELWAFPFPYTGDQVGYKTSETVLGVLSGGQYFQNVFSGNIAFTYPPNGQWYFTMVLTEFTGIPINDGFFARSWYNFPGPVTVGPALPLSPPKAIEFYHSGLDHFFVTADPVEANGIANGAAGPGWSATGQTFKVGGGTGVCRFYGSMTPGPNSHFYTVDPGECQFLKDLQSTTPSNQKRWNYEGIAFGAARPLGGTCPAGLMPVFRAYNNGHARGVDSNHRLTSSVSAYQAQIAKGWIGEGVAMCVP